ncbi:MAG: hypothetical protein ACI8PZ_002651 [Myxococcota bacterium]|jgi:hypothetical protein
MSDGRPGRFLAVDAEGFLVKDVGLDRVPPAWGPAVEAAVEAYRAALGADLHSVWLRGSAVSGHAVLGVSDLDTLALARRAPGAGGLWVDLPGLVEAEAMLTAPGCTGVELCAASVDALATERGAFLRFLLATQGCRVEGEAVSLPRYRVDRSICFVSGHVVGALRVARRDVSTDEDPPGLTRWLAKTLVRAGLERVLERDGRYARDLWPCYLAFAAHEPEHAPWMLRAVDAAVEPGEGDLEFLLEVLGPWLVAGM